MLLKRHAPRIDDGPSEPVKGFEHLDHGTVAVLRWLGAARIEFVLVGPVAAAIRGATGAGGPVSIVPAPYGRNLERLERALQAERLYSRVDGGGPAGQTDLTSTKLTAEMLGRGQLRTLRVGAHDLDVEASASGLPSYQDLLYEASSFEVGIGVKVEVASPEDIELYAHVRRTGVAPEITIKRRAELESEEHASTENGRAA